MEPASGQGSRRAALADVLVACLFAAGLCWWSLRTRTWSDFLFEAGPAVQRLLAGDVHGFLTLSPSYGGSLLLRAPLLALGGALGGMDGAYRLGAAGAAAGLACLALLLAARMRAAGRPAVARWLMLGLQIANPACVYALRWGHPEDLMATALCIGGVLAAGRGRVTLAGLALGAAFACKEWALLGLPVALATAPRGRVRLAAAAALGAGGLLAPFLFASASRFAATGSTITDATVVFHPEQLWRALGMFHMHSLGGSPPIVIPVPSAFVARISHPLIVALAVPVAAALWLRRRRLEPGDALLALAALALLRCVLDPWDVVYYHLPFLVALCAWESLYSRRPPLLTLAAAVLVWLSFVEVGVVRGADVACAFYLSWALPATAALLARSLRLTLPLPATRGTRWPRRRTVGPALRGSSAGPW